MQRSIAAAYSDPRSAVAPVSGARGIAAAWLGLASAAFALAALIALALLALKLPGVESLLPGAARLFSTGLALHVNLGMNVWLLCCGAAVNAIVFPPRSPRLAWAAFGLALAGSAAISISAFLGARVVMSNYVPVIDHPVFFAGCAWIASGVLLATLGALWRAPQEPHARAAAPLRAAAWTVVGALLALGAAMATRPEGLSRNASFEVLFWGYGHVLQLAFVLWMIAAWQALARDASGGRWMPALAALWGYALLLAAGWIVANEPAASIAYRESFTRQMSWGSWLAPAVFVVVAAFGGGLRVRGGVSPEREFFLWSAALFAMGCIAGAWIRGESALVPAHYHGTIGAVSLALMGWCPQLLAAAGREMPAAALRPALRAYGGGLGLLIAGLAWLGREGLPRKALGTALDEQAGAIFALALAVTGGVVAIAGATEFALRLIGALRRRLPQAARASFVPETPRRDVRPRAIAVALLAVALGGGAVSWLIGDAGGRRGAGRVDARVDPAGHARGMQRAEFDARFRQAVLMLHARHYEHALTALHRLLEIAPDVPEVHVNMGYTLLGLQRYAAARDFFLGATELRPAQANAYYGLAVALEALGDMPAALGAMRTYVHLTVSDDPWLPKARAALWEWQSRAGTKPK